MVNGTNMHVTGLRYRYQILVIIFHEIKPRQIKVYHVYSGPVICHPTLSRNVHVPRYLGFGPFQTSVVS